MESNGPLEVIYLSIDPESVPDAIDLDPVQEVAGHRMEPKQRRFLWWVIGLYTLLFGVGIISQNGWLIFLVVMAMFFVLYVGIKLIRQNVRVGALWLGAVVAVTGMMYYLEQVVNPPEVRHQDQDNGSALQQDYDTQDADQYVLDATSANSCEYYLKGKTFIGNSARLEFGYDGTVSAYNLSGDLVFGGTLEIGASEGPVSRWIYVRDMLGAGKLEFLLSADGKMMEPSSLVIYNPS